MKKTVFGALLALALLFVCCLSPAEETLTFTQGVPLVLFDENGVKVTLTGEVEDAGLSIISLPAVIENNTDHAICVSYQGTGNGWTISRSVFGNSGSNVAKKSKAKTFLWFEYDALDIQRFSDLESVTLAFSVEKPVEDFGVSGETYFTVDDLTIDFAGGGEAVRELAYFSESPSLPLPTSYADVYESGSGKSTLNGKITSIRYSYRPSSHADSAADMLKQYMDGLKNAGYTVSGSANSYTIRNGNTKLATVSLDGSGFKIEIEPGNERLTATPSAASPAQPAAQEPSYKIGDTLRADNVRLTLARQGTADILYSYLGSEPDYWFYLEPQSGKQFFFLQGKFTNNGSRAVDINRLYLEAEFDGKYYYDGSARALRPDGKNFQNDVDPQTTVDYYIYFEVPQSVLNSYKTCTIRIGVDNSFGVRFRSNGGYDFKLCDSVFEVDCSKAGKNDGASDASVKASGTQNSLDLAGYYACAENDYLILAPNGHGTGEVLWDDGYWYYYLFSWAADGTTFTMTDIENNVFEAAIKGSTLDFGEGADQYTRNDDLATHALTDVNGVRRMQELLNEAGYDCGTADGKAGKKTRSALEAFQRDNGLTITGECTLETFIHLGSAMRDWLFDTEKGGEAAANAADEPEPVDDSAGEIRFQGIAWGAGRDETRQALVDCGLVSGVNRLSPENSGVGYLIAAKPSAHVEVYSGFDEVSMMDVASSVSGRIAGYEVDHIAVIYAYELEGSQADRSKTHFLSVYVALKANDALAAFKDLSSKLNTVYGAPSKTFYETEDGGMRMWTGSSETSVVLRSVSPGGAELFYGKVGDYETLQALLSAVSAPIDGSDLSGL